MLWLVLGVAAYMAWSKQKAGASARAAQSAMKAKGRPWMPKDDTKLSRAVWGY